MDSRRYAFLMSALLAEEAAGSSSVSYGCLAPYSSAARSLVGYV